MKKPLLEFTNKGIYCAVANVYLDPWRKVDNALITHGHSDHSRYGCKRYITHHHNVPIIKSRLGNIEVSGKNWGETFTINGAKFSLHPTGHIVGSSQIRVAYKGEVWVYTGDYKWEDDGLSTPYESIKCHAFITECTFGLPPFLWQPQQQVFDDINTWWEENKKSGLTSVLFGYSLGKAQRLIKHLDTSIGKIYTHGAVEKMNEVIRSVANLPETHPINRDTTKESLKGNIIIAPLSANGTTWLRKAMPYATANASGWMTFRGARRRSAVDRGFVLSDHCDWPGLLKAIKECEAEKIICTHGYTTIFSKYLRELGYDARTEKTQYGEHEEDNVSIETMVVKSGGNNDEK